MKENLRDNLEGDENYMDNIKIQELYDAMNNTCLRNLRKFGAYKTQIKTDDNRSKERLAVFCWGFTRQSKGNVIAQTKK
mgnify:CR=1 FL=1